MTDFAKLLTALVEGNVRFVIVGGVAATLHGSARLTQDLDIVYERSAENVTSLARALSALQPYLRGAPPGLPFVLDSATIRHGLNFTLQTAAGAIHLLGEISGVGGYANVSDRSESVTLFGIRVKVIDLDGLIAAKRAAGRPKDLEVIAELEALRDDRSGI